MSQTCGCGCGHAAATAEVVGAAIAPGDTIDMVVKRVPGVVAVLREMGIDTCCGGNLTLVQAAASAGIPAARILQALRERAGAS
jgi:iron-sulfur cluster repair protein YtfE (RIC family)